MKTTIDIYSCDVCRKSIDDIHDMYASECNPEIIKIEYERWYAGVYSSSHICKTCQQSILKLIKSLSPAEEVQIKYWKKL